MIVKYIIDFLFPRFCVFCLKEGKSLCFGCKKRVLEKFSLGLREVEFEFEGGECFLDGLYAVIGEKGIEIGEKLVHMYKYENKRDLAEVFAEVVDIAVSRSCIEAKSVIAPVKSHKKRVLQRGFDNILEIARKIEGVRSIAFVERKRFLKTQVGLGKEDRLKNVKNAFVINKKLVKPEFFDCRVYLFDDVCTTAATLNEAAKVLKKVGFKEVFGLVLIKK